MEKGQQKLFNTEVPKMPEEFIGQNKTWGGITKTIPREWTPEEIQWCVDLRNQGYTSKQIAESTGRELTSVKLKFKKMGKRNDTYNDGHIDKKYQTNDEFYNFLKPSTVLDVYAGEKSYWKTKCECRSNDKNEKLEADYHMDALKFLCQEYLEGNKYDLIDLDPFGSAWDCFDLAIKTATKGLIITYGEWGSKRWKRTDYVKYTYGIDNPEDFTIENLIEKTRRIAKHNHKDLNTWKICKWKNIARVYYEITEFKITEQWDTKEEEA